MADAVREPIPHAHSRVIEVAFRKREKREGGRRLFIPNYLGRVDNHLNCRIWAFLVLSLLFSTDTLYRLSKSAFRDPKIP